MPTKRYKRSRKPRKQPEPWLDAETVETEFTLVVKSLLERGMHPDTGLKVLCKGLAILSNEPLQVIKLYIEEKEALRATNLSVTKKTHGANKKG